MKKLINSLLLSILSLFLFTGSVYAANTSIRLQQPGTPTNDDTFNITFVALDTDPSQPVSVQCYKKGPTDAIFSAFGSVINLSNGGNTDNCQVNSGTINQGNGTYRFNAQVVTGSSTPTSSTVSVDFNNSTPDTPTNYSKSKPDDCSYKISFRTANDSGKTVKVVLYRSADSAFSLDTGHQVNSISIGSDTDGSMTNNISPNCSTEYYYAIRAFDTYGNGSGSVGDSNITTTTINPTGTTAEQGAIPITSGEGSVLGTETEKGEILGTESSKTKEVKGTESSKTVGALVVSPLTWIMTHKKISLSTVVILLVIAYFLYRRFKK